jgi:uncharacterized protein (TIGR03435 family)
MKIFRPLAILFAFAGIHALSQIPPPSVSQPEFEVASIRMVPHYSEQEILRGLGNHPWGEFPANRFTGRHLDLKLFIALAYGVDQKNIQGDPSWLDDQEYDIEAKVEGDKALSYQEIKPLLQHLLEERFHLVTHRATKLTSGYALVVAKGGPKLQPGEDQPSTNGYILSNAIRSRSISMGSFASMLSRPIGYPIVDKTGITGYFDITLSYAPANDPKSSLPDIFTAVQEQLGLKLEPLKVPVDSLVIDHVDKIPTEN